MNSKFQQLVKLFQRLPGVGPRQAARFVVALLDQPEESLVELGTAISTMRREISFCGECFNISDPAPSLSADHHSEKGRAWSGAGNHSCHICNDPKRDAAKLMVVEKVTDLESMEKTGLYKGLYHVLGGALNPLEKVAPANLRIKELENRIDKSTDIQPIELILATNPNTPGEATALYLRDLFANKKGVSITRLGRGLSSGSHLEYADEMTLKNALESRK